MTILFVGAGRNAGLRPGDLVGAITGEAHLTSKQIGAIRVGQTHTLVEVPEQPRGPHHHGAPADEAPWSEGGRQATVERGETLEGRASARPRRAG